MLDPVTLAVLNGRLEQIADEMDATLYRSAFNPIIAEAHDACHGLYDASGATLVQGKSGLPVFVGAMSFAVQAAARAAQARGGMRDGDVWILNDPYDGGTHANDFKLVRPVFRGGELYCYLASAAHWHDVGGAVPGNYNPAATECWQEAVQIPPVRMARRRAGRGRAGHPEGQFAPARQPVGRPERSAGRAGTGRGPTRRSVAGVRRRHRAGRAGHTAPARPAPDAGPRSQPAGRRVPLSRHAGQRRRQGRRATIAPLARER